MTHVLRRVVPFLFAPVGGGLVVAAFGDSTLTLVVAGVVAIPYALVTALLLEPPRARAKVPRRVA